MVSISRKEGVLSYVWIHQEIACFYVNTMCEGKFIIAYILHGLLLFSVSIILLGNHNQLNLLNDPNGRHAKF